MATNKYVSFDRLVDYDTLIKQEIANGDSASLSSSKDYTDSKVASITNGTVVVKEALHAESANEATNATNAGSAINDGNGNTIVATYETKSDAIAKLDEAKEYTDTKTTNMATTGVVDNKISTHNTSTTAHNDIRTTLTAVKEDVDTFFKDADLSTSAKDTLKELQTYIASDETATSEMLASLANKTDKGHNHAISDVTNLQATLDGKAASGHTHTKSQITDFPSTMKNPYSLTIQGNGTTLTNGTYDGSAVKTVNITPSSIGALPSSGGNVSGHIYLTGAKASSSTGNTSQIIFGTSSENHVAISSNNNAIVINQDATSTTNQIVLYLDKASQFPSGISANVTGRLNGTATSANKLNTDDGSATQPVYFLNGIPVRTTYTLGASVPSDAKFTDTVYTHPSYTAITGKPTANQTPSFGGTATVSQITSDTTGHVTGATDRTITIPSTLSNGTGTAGLIKTSSTVTSSSGYTACPVINGVPYYKDTKNTYTLSSFGITATAAELNALDGITATVTELNYCDGVTSNIQTQLNAKQATISGGASTITSSNLTVNRALISNGSGKVAVSAVTSTELGYLDGVTSAIQTQLNSKAASSHSHSTSDITSGTLSSDRLPTVPVAKGGTGATTAASAATNIIQNQSIKPAAVEFMGASSHGGYIDFHYGGGSEDYTSRIIEAANGVLTIQYANPSSNADSGVIATYGQTWVTPTLKNNFTSVADNPIKYRKFADTCQITGRIARSTAIGSSALSICDLPEGFGASYTKHFFCTTSGANIARVYIRPTSNGKAELVLEWIYSFSGTQQTGTVSWIDLDITYFANT